jgi:hypothetical protein
VFSTLFHLSITAQDAPIKFGKIEMSDLQMKVYPKDTAAEAVVLGDIGRAYFDYSHANDNFQIVYERHRRVKILKKSGYDWATIKVPLYNSNKAERRVEDFYELQGVTYNLINGQIVKDKLEKESVFLDKKDENHSIKRFAFPKVKEGSIIEYTYKIRSDFYYNFHDWVFQSSIPVAWSEFSVSIPNYFRYRQLTQGSQAYAINKAESGVLFFTIKNEAEDSGGGMNSSRTQSTFEKVSTESKEFKWAMKDLPALRNEPYMTTIDDYVSKIQFELSSTYSPKSILKNYSNTWESLNDLLLESESFGLQLNRSGFLKDMVSTIKASSKDTLTQIGMAYKLIKQNMTWDGNESIYCSSNLKKALETRIGNVADINLMLVVLLKELGYNSNPVILSTRDNGHILNNYVLLSRFNYVIAQVNIGGKDLLLDATATETPIGILPLRCLNGSGRLIEKNKTRWVNLQPSQKDSKTGVCNLQLNPQGGANGDLTISHLGYSNTEERIKYVKEGKDKYFDNLKKQNTNWQFVKSEIENTDKVAEPFINKHEIIVHDFSSVSGDRIYFNPMLYNAQKDNPFKSYERQFPVDFGVLIERNFIATYTIPKGYTTEEIPKSIKIAMPEDGARFTYAISTSDDGKLSIMSKIIHKKTVYYPEEYEALRKFYDQIIQKHAEQIVLKKK